MTGWWTPDVAALWLGTTIGNVHVLAYRRGWRRQRINGHIHYSAVDVDDTRVDRQLTTGAV